MKRAIHDIFQLRHIPLSRWPMRYHIALAAGICALVVALGLMGLQEIKWQIQYVGSQHAALEDELVSLRTASFSNVSSDPTKSFPPISHADDVVRDIGRFAQDGGVQVNNLTVNTMPSTPSQVGRVQFNIAAIGSYKSTKTWLSELLARYSSLAVSSLSIQKSQNNPLQQDVHLTLVWYAQTD